MPNYSHERAEVVDVIDDVQRELSAESEQMHYVRNLLNCNLGFVGIKRIKTDREETVCLLLQAATTLPIGRNGEVFSPTTVSATFLTETPSSER